jgi:hypothetical protein
MFRWSAVQMNFSNQSGSYSGSEFKVLKPHPKKKIWIHNTAYYVFLDKWVIMHCWRSFRCVVSTHSKL